ncbi:unnamed protein product [Phyllotreta striolata]|uniref:Uncharacterized protein n=1 Tax=Phyllotreta striolata TaxID=444603 RepID=A0A9N9TMF7_PHYSR|nr:unnamed protein product [Phyllotreta striolata]
MNPIDEILNDDDDDLDKSQSSFSCVSQMESVAEEFDRCKNPLQDIAEILRLKGGKPKRSKICPDCEAAKADKELKLASATKKKELREAMAMSSRCALHEQRDSEQSDTAPVAAPAPAIVEVPPEPAAVATEGEPVADVGEPEPEAVVERRKSKMKSVLKFARLSRSEVDVPEATVTRTDEQPGTSGFQGRDKKEGWFPRVGMHSTEIYKLAMFLLFYNVFTSFR